MTSAPPGNLGTERIPLTRERILEAAVAIVDDQGVGALSMRRLGAALGVEAMSIYNHIPSKDALLEALVEVLIAQVEIPPEEDDWAERLKKMSRSYRSLVMAHPHFVELIATRPYAGLPVLRQTETIFEILEAAGLEESKWMDVVRSFSSFAIGFTLSEAVGILSETEPSAGDLDYEAFTTEFPRLIKMIPYMEGLDANAQFEYGLELFVEGLKAKLSK